MQVSARMVPGTHYVIDARFPYVDLLAVVTDSPAALINGAIPLQHGVPRTRRLVKEWIAARVVFHRRVAHRTIERPRHACQRISLRNLCVARGAQFRIDVGIARRLGMYE